MKMNFKFILALLTAIVISGCEGKSDTEKTSETGTEEKASDSKSENSEEQALAFQSLETALQMKGQKNEGEYKVTVPQNDLNVVVDGFKIIPPMGLGSWAAFSSTGDGVMLMGDIVVTEKDLKPVQKEIIDQGLTITAIHNHFVRNEPDVMYMHIGGMGSEQELGQKVKAVFDKVAEIRGSNPGDAKAGTVENSLNTKAIDSILGHTGSMNNGVYKLTIGRPDVDLTEHDASVSTFMGFNTWASWQGTPENAAVAGDFTMLEDEVAPVIKALIENDIEVVAVHNHMVHEEPRIFFLHYWGIGNATKLAQGLRQALDQTGKE